MAREGAVGAKSIDEAFAAYQAHFGELHALHQLRFFGDEDVIQMLLRAVDSGEPISAEMLESRLPPDAFY